MPWWILCLSLFLPLHVWWAPKMDNYLGSFNLLIWLNPPFSLVYCMFFIIFMLIEWIGLAIMPTSLMCALCSLFDQFGNILTTFIWKFQKSLQRTKKSFHIFGANHLLESLLHSLKTCCKYKKELKSKLNKKKIFFLNKKLWMWFFLCLSFWVKLLCLFRIEKLIFDYFASSCIASHENEDNHL